MLEKWTGLSQDNKVKLIVIVLGAVLAAAGYLGKSWLEVPAPDAANPVNRPNAQSPGGPSVDPTITLTTEPAQNTPPASTVHQTTSEYGSPAVSNTKGDVTITINGSNSKKKP